LEKQLADTARQWMVSLLSAPPSASPLDTSSLDEASIDTSPPSIPRIKIPAANALSPEVSLQPTAGATADPTLFTNPASRQ
jgi:hypothetical protein